MPGSFQPLASARPSRWQRELKVQHSSGVPWSAGQPWFLSAAWTAPAVPGHVREHAPELPQGCFAYGAAIWLQAHRRRAALYVRSTAG